MNVRSGIRALDPLGAQEVRIETGTGVLLDKTVLCRVGFVFFTACIGGFIPNILNLDLPYYYRALGSVVGVAFGLYLIAISEIWRRCDCNGEVVYSSLPTHFLQMV